jgi:membrane protein implicated in regulation of membrane protease activity
MIVVLGLIVLVLAVGLGVAGVSANAGADHALGEGFSIIGLNITGLSTGQLFLLGIAVGVAAMLGLSMLMGVFGRRLASRGSRRELRTARQQNEALLQDRSTLTGLLEADRRPKELFDASATADGTAQGSAAPSAPQPPRTA